MREQTGNSKEFSQKVEDWLAPKLVDLAKDSVDSLYKHVGFAPGWVMCPLDFATNMYWYADEGICRYADSKEQFYSEGNYYQDDIYKQRFYKKHIYRGKLFTMVMCDPGVDGVQWFRFFDNSKELPLNQENMEISKNDIRETLDKYSDRDELIDKLYNLIQVSASVAYVKGRKEAIHNNL